MNHILNFLWKTFVVACAIGIVTSIIGWLLKWNSAIQFSDGFFWAGAILIILGTMSVTGDAKMRADFKVLYSQSAGDMNTFERSKRWVSDMVLGYNLFVFLLFVGIYLIIFAVLIPNIF